MTEPLASPAALATTSAEGASGSAALAVEANSVQALVETRDSLIRLLEAAPPDFTAVRSLFRERVTTAEIDVIPLDDAGEVAFLSRPPQDPVVLIVAPRPDRVCLAVDPRLPAELLRLALL